MNEPAAPDTSPDKEGEGEPESPVTPSPAESQSSQRKQRPTKVLPTERVSFPKQKEALAAYASIYDSTNKPAGNMEVAKLLGINPSTVGLMNGFFLDTGLLEKSGRGFVPSDALKDYQHAIKWQEESPGHRLGPVLAKTWGAQELLPHLGVAPRQEKDAIQILARAANADRSYRLNFQTLLDYLELAGLIERDGGMVRIPPPSSRNTPLNQPPASSSEELEAPKPPGTSRTVSLASGGTLTISATLDLFSLSQKDRNFVFTLIDQLEEYETGGSKATTGKESKEET